MESGLNDTDCDFKILKFNFIYFNHFKQVKQKYRSFKKIQEDFKSLELDLKTDMEILNDLMGKFKDIKEMKSNQYNDVNAGENDPWLNTLLDLEYLVHQVDNARLFIKMNG